MNNEPSDATSLAADIFVGWRFFVSKDGASIFGLAAVAVVVGITELLSIGSVAPFVQTIMSGESSEAGLSYPLNKAELLFPLFLLLAVSLRLAFIYLSINVGYKIGHRLAVCFLESQLFRDFYSFRGSSSEDVISLVVLKSNICIQCMIMPIINILAGAFSITLVAIGLAIYVGPHALLVVFLFIVIYAIIIRLIKNKLRLNSVLVKESSTDVVRPIQVMFDGFQEVVVYNLQGRIIDHFSSADKTLRSVQGQNNFLSQAPRHLIEFIGISLFVVWLFLGGFGAGDQLDRLAVVALVAQRSLPYAQQVYGGISSIIGGSATIREAVAVLRSFDRCSGVALIGVSASRSDNDWGLKEAVEIKWDSCSVALGDVSKRTITIPDGYISRGALTAVVGASGSGKTTFINHLCGVVSGFKVFLHGAVKRTSCETTFLREWMSFVSQEPLIFEGSIRSYFKFFDSKVADDDIWSVIADSGFDEVLKDRPCGLEFKLDEGGGNLSGGQRQRLSIARGLLSGKEVYVFDEPTSALDNASRDKVCDALKSLAQKGKFVVVISHDNAVVSRADAVIKMG